MLVEVASTSAVKPCTEFKAVSQSSMLASQIHLKSSLSEESVWAASTELSGWKSDQLRG